TTSRETRLAANPHAPILISGVTDIFYRQERHRGKYIKRGLSGRCTGSACYNRRPETDMVETLGTTEAVLEVISPDGARRYARVAQTPYLRGRGAETGEHWQLDDRTHSRQAARRG